MRSSFRVWCKETGVADDDIAEFCLGYVEGSKTVAAYQRSTMIEARATVMQAWADHLAGSAALDVPSFPTWAG